MRLNKQSHKQKPSHGSTVSQEDNMEVYPCNLIQIYNFLRSPEGKYFIQIKNTHITTIMCSTFTAIGNNGGMLNTTINCHTYVKGNMNNY